MRTRRLMIVSLCSFIILCSVGCNKIDERVSQSDEIMNEIAISSENQSNEENERSNIKLDYEKNEEYVLKTGVTFYVLEDEYLENNDARNPQVSELKRQFTCYDGVRGQKYPYSTTVFLAKVDNIQDCRMTFLLNYPDDLKLPPSTIVSINVLNKWKSQNYDGSGSYFHKSPEGLTWSQIQ